MLTSIQYTVSGFKPTSSWLWVSESSALTTRPRFVCLLLSYYFKHILHIITAFIISQITYYPKVHIDTRTILWKVNIYFPRVSHKKMKLRSSKKIFYLKYGYTTLSSGIDAHSWNPGMGMAVQNFVKIPVERGQNVFMGKTSSGSPFWVSLHFLQMFQKIANGGALPPSTPCVLLLVVSRH